MPDLPSRLQAVLAARYTIEREIGRGGMATVFLARDVRHDRQVALKVLRPDISALLGPDRFLREIKLAARLAHPHILPLHDSGEADGLLFYVMPYVPGASLRHRLEHEGVLPVADALAIAREVAGALEYAHREGVVHRDIKPENILLEEGHAVVADFGIARAISAAGGPRMTAVGVAVGTPNYMSPEQASGEHEVDGRSDIYSLGCVLYEALAGRPPFAGATAVEIMSGHRTQLVPRLGRAGMPPQVAITVERALAKRPGERFGSAAEFARQLQSAASGVAPRWPAALRRYRKAAAGAGVALAAAGVALLPRVGGARLDASLYAVVPFGVRGDAPSGVLDGDHCESVLYEALGRWEDVRLVSDLRVHDRLLQLGGEALTLGTALTLARDLGAGRLVWGEVMSLGDSVQVRGVLYDVDGAGRPVRVHTVRVGKSLVDIGNKLGHLGDSLLVGRMRSPDAADGVLGTRVLAAWQAYEDGHAARARWDLPAAVRAFRAAVETDPPFPHANLWLGQTMMWAGEPAAAWRAYAAAAAAGADRLGPRERALAGALVSLARRQYSDACGSYRNLVARDTMDFAAWFGLGECLSGDRLVVPDPQSRSGWRFRASYFAAAQSYNRALQLVPSVHRIFAGVGFARLAQLFFAESGMYRAGYALIPDSARFGAFPEESGDTLAFVPYPIDDVLAGRREANPASTASAIERNRQTVRQLASEWVEAFSGSADAHETLALALETLGEIGDATDGLALAATRRARALARDPAQQLRLAVAEVRLLVKLRRFGRARELADTLLKGAAQAAASEAAQLAALAALTGRVDRAAALLRQTAPLDTPRTWGGEPVIAPLPVKETALELLAYASLGAPLDSLRILPARVEERITTWVEPARRQRVRDAVLHVPMSFAFPQVGVSPVHRGSTGGNYLLEIQWVLARGDTGTVRARLARLQSFRAADRPGDVAIDAAYQEAALLLAVGDSAAAARLLDQLLEALPALGAALLAQVSQAGALVRAMALRAELAAQEGDGARARRWAQGVVELWSDADASLEPVVQRMRAVAAG